MAQSAAAIDAKRIARGESTRGKSPNRRLLGRGGVAAAAAAEFAAIVAALNELAAGGRELI